jgi:HAD superfamily hydrolase (TIGR01549 family)
MEQYKNIGGIVFDFDGTLFTPDIDWDAVWTLLQNANVDGTSIGEKVQTLMDLDRHDVLDELTRIEIEGCKRGEVITGASEMLSSLAHVKKAIVTRNSRQAVEYVFARLGLSSETLVIGREDVTKLKPHPEGLKLALEKMKLRPDQTIMIGDTHQDIECAHAADVQAVIVHNDHLEFEPKGADRYIKSLSTVLSLVE